MQQLHYIQMQILRELLFAKEKTFSDLNKLKLENNQHNFHLKKLLELEYIKKTENAYTLTTKGKEFANTMDTDNNKIVKQAKLSAVCACFRGAGKEQKVLIYTRLKQPFYESQGFFTGKIHYGETVDEGAVRELQEETGMTGNPEVRGLRHFRVYSKPDKKLVEDKFMFYVVFNNPEGELHPHNEGKYEWVNVSDMRDYMTKPFPNFYNSFELLMKEKDFYFKETDVITEGF